MFDFQDDILDLATRPVIDDAHLPSRQLRLSKRVFDIAVSLLLLPVLGLIAAGLLVLNPVFNRGSLMHRQLRMGYAGQPFMAYKFRSMRHVVTHTRGAFDRLEEDRISKLGALMRKCRIDELPQILNVLRKEMSLIGPRPDLFDHALAYQKQVPGYAARHQVMPGISGLAQTEIGYVDGLKGIRRKVAADHYYIAHASLRFDLWIAWRTLCVIAGCKGR
ncbi:lipopolysaccharide/colanic/teichoic acid biosynthesis glycosyltransferase [Loktanella sp. PT4BL]|jgi:lipopolysaccharide/colanic/teichoic acid biosynthesis glycosyltransferase|uniref:sugar transferase n=1 Tax=Loktanella sp. PT4BL TaxID=2135611 RepID=UPI000D75D9A7|nr:sugar transferase [Loktanella sp. PT4BL]PXW68942.1 lipopolysaccharide/colanic/teichoic acid biosynthesis glycosyltransferase [Loktanella sp. PT4BL]